MSVRLSLQSLLESRIPPALAVGVDQYKRLLEKALWLTALAKGFQRLASPKQSYHERASAGINGSQ